MTTQTIHEEVQARYAEAALQASSGGCCSGEPETFGAGLYSALERAELPEAAVLASLGCGNPIAVAELHEGERVLDLGSGGGIDVLLSAQRVGPTGRAYRPRHDRRDARPRPAQRGRGRRHQRRVPEAAHRGHPAARGIGRRRHLQLRHQPRRRQAGRVPRDRPRAAPGRPDRHHRHRRRGPPDARRAGRARLATPAASPARSPSPSSSRASTASASPTCRSPPPTRSPTAWTAPSSGHASRAVAAVRAVPSSPPVGSWRSGEWLLRRGRLLLTGRSGGRVRRAGRRGRSDGRWPAGRGRSRRLARAGGPDGPRTSHWSLIHSVVRHHPMETTGGGP